MTSPCYPKPRPAHSAPRLCVILSAWLALLATPAAGQCCTFNPQASGNWGYEAPAVEPAQWSTISPECAGLRQSPIDLPQVPPIGGMGAPEYLQSFTQNSSFNGDLTFTDVGHTLKLDLTSLEMDLASSLAANAYRALQLHFHAPSEHTFGGQSYPLEVHFVHLSGPDLLVLGFLYTPDATASPDPLLTALIANTPAGDGLSTSIPMNSISGVEVAKMIRDRSFWTYPGSLTTPPCSEGVSWFVAHQPIPAPPQQLTAMENSLGITNRPPQPLNGRTPRLIQAKSRFPSSQFATVPALGVAAAAFNFDTCPGK